MMRDFCKSNERDSIRIIVAQDLKENGIDLDTVQKPQIQPQNGKHQMTMNKANISSTINDPDMDVNHVFGLPLKNLEMIEVKQNDQILNVPVFLKYSIEYLTQYLNVEGIFRRNGTASRLRELKRQIEAGQYDFSQFGIFDVTSLVKLFFRELPESLLTFALYSHFIQAIKLIDASKSKSAILNLCVQLPDINLHVLIYLMQFLKQISIHDADNKMNSFNLAVCFAPNIIYTRINKINELYINEERMIIQFLIENSSLIGKVSDSVYERSLMLTSLCCADGKDFDAEQESFTTARSTSLSSYCNNNKEKKKRRSSSLKELMTTIQNSISKFRRRSASEKNDKTTCSMISTDSSRIIVGDEKPPIHIQATPYKLLTPMPSNNLYTPRIKRNAEESIQTTTKKKLLEKLPQRNLLPNAPMTPFSASKKNKHPTKASENKVTNTTQPCISMISSSVPCAPINCTPTQHNYLSTQPITATPLNVVNLQKQLKYDDSPSVLFASVSTSINPIYDSSNLKLRSQHKPKDPFEALSSSNNDRNHTIASGEFSSDCRRRLEMSNIDTSSKYGYNRNSHYHNLSTFYSHKRQSISTRANHFACNTIEPIQQHESPTSIHSESTSEYSTTQQRLLTESMRCSLKRGRPNTPKTGLNTEYRNRKSSVHTSPELILRAKENFEKQQHQHNPRLDDNLNTAIILDDDEDGKNADGDLMNNPLYSNLDDLNDARLDEAICIGVDDESDDDCDEDSGLNRDDLKVENIENESQIELEERLNANRAEELVGKSTDDCGGDGVKENESCVANQCDSFECDQKSIIEITRQKFTQIDNLDNSVNMLRRQSLFKLKEKMSGRVSKQISEIEKRKLSAYRFSNSTLKRANNISKKSPLSSKKAKFSKTLLRTPIMEEQFFTKSFGKIDEVNENDVSVTTATPSSDPTRFNAKASGDFSTQMRKLTRNKSVKRLNKNTSKKSLQSPLSKSVHNSPTSSLIMHTTQLNYASESFDL